MAKRRRPAPRRGTRRRGPQPVVSPPRFPTQPELVVIARPEASLRARGTTVEGARAAEPDSLTSLLTRAGARLRPIFGATETRARTRMATLPGPRPELPDLATFYTVDVAPDRMADLAGELSDHPAVAAAFVKPGAEPPVWIVEEAAAREMVTDAPPVTPDFVSRQGYLDPAPGGIDARYAWSRAGGRGAGVRIIDIEGAWHFSHEDLLQNQGGVIGGTPTNDLAWRNHGTAVVGEFGADENAFGVTGICPEANVRAISIFGGPGSAGAIRQAADALGPGDIILIELHRPGPRHNFQNRADQLGYIAVEWWPDDFAAIAYATARGVIVIEAAGNGAENLDDAIYNTRPSGFPSTWRNPFNRANPQCGAILVGAGAPPPGTHGRNHGADRSRLSFSNFGACVDVQGWGREVTTTGGSHSSPGDLQGGSDEDVWYTDQFSGTSSASPIVVGAVGALQGVLRAAGRPLLTPATARDILRTTGSPQQDEPGRPASQRIGNRPDLRQAINRLLPPIKIKEIKEGIKEHIKEKELKELRKETKERLKELKDLRKETKELKEKDRKEIKEKDLKDIKEVKEKDLKDVGEGPSGTTGASSLESRLDRLEEAVSQLTHFITAELRPDLVAATVGSPQDPGVDPSAAGTAADEKAAKDAKDIEKPREA